MLKVACYTQEQRWLRSANVRAWVNTTDLWEELTEPRHNPQPLHSKKWSVPFIINAGLLYYWAIQSPHLQRRCGQGLPGWVLHASASTHIALPTGATTQPFETENLLYCNWKREHLHGFEVLCLFSCVELPLHWCERLRVWEGLMIYQIHALVGFSSLK